MPTAAIYCRVSTAGQVSSDPWASLPRQSADLRALAERLGLAVVLEEVEQASGAKADRPGWARILEACRAGEVSAVLVVSFDRLTRSERLAEWERVKDELRAHRVRLITIKQGEIPLSGSADDETRGDFDAVLSKRERLVTRQRTMEGRAHKGRAGGYTGHHPPHGYAVAFHQRTGAKFFEVDGPAAATVRRVFELYLAGASVAAIARALNADGTPTPAAMRPGAHGHWYDQTIRDMLKSPCYTGLSAWHRGREAPVESTVWPVLIERADWEAVQARVALMAFCGPRGPAAMPLSGLLRCPSCDGKMVHRVGSANPRCRSGRNAATYGCKRDARNPPECPKRVYLRRDLTEDAVLAYLAERLPLHLAAQEVASHGRKRARPAKATDGKAAAERARLEAKRSALLDWVLEDPATRGAAGDAKLSEITARLAVLDAAARDAAKVVPMVGAAQWRQLHDMAALLREDFTDPADRRALFEAVIRQVTVERTSPPRTQPPSVGVARLQLVTGEWL